MKERLGNILGENTVKYMWVELFTGFAEDFERKYRKYSFQSGKIR